ncbi:MAG: tetratricopeptide repeat protein [Fermentimonas sp.]|jgi:tetratricopeptide (TPR) repeat protein
MSTNNKNETRAEKNLENINEALTSTEKFLEKNQKQLLLALLAVVVVVGGILAFHYLHRVPKREEAQTAIFKGERYFQEGQDSLAIFGNGNDYIGFEAIIDKYKGTQTADLAHAYAGISYSRMGNNEKALEHLKKFKGGDILVTPAITGSIGDVYLNMGDSDNAISQYMKAAKSANDNLISPIFYKKAGEVYISKGDYDKAIETFTTIKTKYLNTPEGQEADKYITQAKMLKGEN